MGVVERLARRVMADGAVGDPTTVARQVERLKPTEAPLLRREEATEVVDTVVGLGPLEPLLRDPDVSDVLVNSDGSTWVERAGSLQSAPRAFAGPDQLIAAVGRVLAPLGLSLDRSTPAVDARLPDGSRLHAMVPPASVDGPVLAIRRFNPAATDLDDLVGLGSIDVDGAALLAATVGEKRNVLVCGSTGSGKTTLLNVLSSEIPAEERVVTIEDAAELRLAGHVVRLEGRPPNSEGAGAISQRQLLRHALRLRPDRIVVGEVRGAEAFDMLQALSTGHEGSMSTLHAGSAEEALWRLETLALLEPAASARAIRRQVNGVIDVIVVVGRVKSRRVVRSLHHVDGSLSEVYSCS